MEKKMKVTKDLFMKKINIKNVFIGIVLLIFSILISLKSTTSFLNFTKHLDIDVSVWVYIVNRMKDGAIVYKDLFDHKGPLLYFIYYIGNIICGVKGIGMIGFIATLVDVIFIYKISRKLSLNKSKSVCVVAINMLFLTFLCGESPSAETLALPFILISLFAFIKFILNIDDFKIKESIYTRFEFRNSFINKT